MIQQFNPLLHLSKINGRDMGNFSQVETGATKSCNKMGVVDSNKEEEERRIDREGSSG